MSARGGLGVQRRSVTRPLRLSSRVAGGLTRQIVRSFAKLDEDLRARQEAQLSPQALEWRAQAIVHGLKITRRAYRASLRAMARELLRSAARPPLQDLELVVLGVPRPQGSLDVFPSRTTGRMVAKHPKGLLRWRNTVRLAARKAMGRRPLFSGPLAMHAIFYLPRPKSLPKSITKPERKPDKDKLERAIGDALEGVVYLNDAQITASSSKKRFGSPPRCEIRIGPDLEP